MFLIILNVEIVDICHFLVTFFPVHCLLFS